MQITENGKVYNYDPDLGLVVEASVEDTTPVRGIEAGDRVEVEGRTGRTLGYTPSMYGQAWAVQFDDGTIGEYSLESLAHSDTDPVEFETPISEVLARYATYEEQPAITTEEIEAKTAEARWLNLRAKSLIQQGISANADLMDMHTVVASTTTDLIDLADMLTTARVASDQKRLSSLNQFRFAKEIISNQTMGSKSDASWLDDAIDGMEVVEMTDSDLATVATDMVSHFNSSQLKDDTFLADAASYQVEYLNMDDAQRSKFSRYVDAARNERLANFPKPAKTASVEDENLDDFDTTALFI